MGALRPTSAISAMMPPSPLLSARMTKIIYLSETMMISDQNTNDRMPIMLSRDVAIGFCPANTSFMVYKGLVPMSPKTTPMAAMASPVVPWRCDSD